MTIPIIRERRCNSMNVPKLYELCWTVIDGEHEYLVTHHELFRSDEEAEQEWVKYEVESNLWSGNHVAEGVRGILEQNRWSNEEREEYREDAAFQGSVYSCLSMHAVEYMYRGKDKYAVVLLRMFNDEVTLRDFIPPLIPNEEVDASDST